MSQRFLVIDTETGGLDCAEDAIISLAAVIYDNGPREMFHVIVNDKAGWLNDSALEINGFTLKEVLRRGVTPREAVARLTVFLGRHGMYEDVVLAGHNLPFDVGFLKRLYRLADMDYDPLFSYDKQFTYGGLDTKGLALALMTAGRLFSKSSSLKDVAPALGLEPWREHDALADALTTAKALERMLNMIRPAEHVGYSASV